MPKVQTLEELKKENEALAQQDDDSQDDDSQDDDSQDDDSQDDDSQDDDSQDDVSQDDDSQDDNSQDDNNVPDFMQSDTKGDMPIAAHIKTKHKLKGRISDQKDEIADLKTAIATMQSAQSTQYTKPETLVLPKEEDYETRDEHNAAVAEYNTKHMEAVLSSHNSQNRAETFIRDIKKKREKAVDAHYDRAGELIAENGIDPELYKASDTIVREAINSIINGKGSEVTDHIISILGKGSEKVVFYLGRNKGALSEFKSLLAEDKTGLSAAIFLGGHKQRLNKTTKGKQKSNARKPSKNIKGDSSKTNANLSRKFKKIYDTAHKSQNIQAAYNAKKEAKIAGIDVNGWI